MQLKDFYYADKHAVGSKMPILLPSGDDSGEWLQVRGPDCDESIKAARAYAAAVRAIDASLEELYEACKAKDDFTEWSEQRSYELEDLNRQLAADLVIGWSFDTDGVPTPFTKEALSELLRQYRGLAPQVAKHHFDSRDALNAK